MNVSATLLHYGIDQQCVLAAVQRVRRIVLDGGEANAPRAAAVLIDKLIDVKVDPVSAFERGMSALPSVWAVSIAQACVEAVIRLQCIVEDGQAIFDSAVQRVERLVSTPNNKWMFAYETAPSVTRGEVVAVCDAVDVKVEVRSDGKIKKGGKQILAEALYHKFMQDKKDRGEIPMPSDNQTFIQLLMAELDMSKAGASTYAFNLRKKHEMVVVKTAK